MDTRWRLECREGTASSEARELLTHVCHCMVSVCCTRIRITPVRTLRVRRLRARKVLAVLWPHGIDDRQGCAG
eukprot:7389249-Prymnesium_polylepis.1